MAESRDHPTEADIKQIADEYGIELGRAYRPAEAYSYLGYKHTQAAEKVKSGEIDPPIALSANGSAVAWLGRQLAIIIWRRLHFAADRRSRAAEKRNEKVAARTKTKKDTRKRRAAKAAVTSELTTS